jgi:hypothetical protein
MNHPSSVGSKYRDSDLATSFDGAFVPERLIPEGSRNKPGIKFRKVF